MRKRLALFSARPLSPLSFFLSVDLIVYPSVCLPSYLYTYVNDAIAVNRLSMAEAVSQSGFV